MAIPLAAELDQVVQDAASAYAVSPTAELHAYALVNGKDDWKDLAPQVRARIGIYDKAMAAIGRRPVKLFLCGVDIPALRRRYSYPEPPHTVVLQHVLERVDEHARSIRERVLFIADEVAEADSHPPGPDRLSQARDSRLPVEQARTGGRHDPLRASRTSLVQAADLIAFLHRRQRTHTGTDKRAARANERIWTHVQPRVVQDGSGCPRRTEAPHAGGASGLRDSLAGLLHPHDTNQPEQMVVPARPSVSASPSRGDVPAQIPALLIPARRDLIA
ncbi:hypothetical protein ACFV9C_42570 [Kribbella sp. NPDC059898]|uniref:hypothetical protein n=1 Tax=Kribbella sp. NPDC059898 TaxID=3346995 RepID=UPI003668A8B3